MRLSKVKIDLTEAHKERFAHCQSPMNLSVSSSFFDMRDLKIKKED